MSLASIATGDLPAVHAELNYLVPMTQRPRSYAYEPPVDTPRTNATHAPHRLPVCDAYNPAHRRFYLSAMNPDEALLIKCFDSRTDGRVRFAPHSAFDDPIRTGGRAAAREHRDQDAGLPPRLAAGCEASVPAMARA